MSIFTPIADSQLLTVIQSSQRVALPTTPVGRLAMSVIMNVQSNDEQITARFGDDTVTVSASNGYVVAPKGQTTGNERIVGVPHGATHVAFIATGTGGAEKKIHVTFGDLISG
jgi:hypothetical protein